MIGDEVNISNKEIYDRALMWGSLNLYLSDKNSLISELKNIGKEIEGNKTKKVEVLNNLLNFLG